MNKVILIGRLTSDPVVKSSDSGLKIARYRLAVDRRRSDGEAEADFISCTAFGKGADFAEKYLYKGMKIAGIGHIQTGSYENRDGHRVYTTDIIIESQEFCEKKGAGTSAAPESDDFMQVPESLEDDLPFH